MWSLNLTWPVQSPGKCLVTSLKSVSLSVCVGVERAEKNQNLLEAKQMITVSRGCGLWSWFGIGNRGYKDILCQDLRPRCYLKRVFSLEERGL